MTAEVAGGHDDAQHIVGRLRDQRTTIGIHRDIEQGVAEQQLNVLSLVAALEHEPQHALRLRQILDNPVVNALRYPQFCKSATIRIVRQKRGAELAIVRKLAAAAAALLMSRRDRQGYDIHVAPAELTKISMLRDTGAGQ
ncbi:hypothetical protein [Lentzea flava]|uniref:DUF5753 domain-containing protein n=1 Tax=Lentzea flava TaxID=103732 RepID=A0ABQ2VHC7_9PSEU|nr:hypothetical protein [Lentzea flava]MCP2205471.1 hypothetical protein [Lentzea flava]GGU87093.1 hypothetical protein GCM10010178_91190 [Lentzea flava]